GMALPAWTSGETPPKWEVRTYFYDGTNCYSEGSPTTIGGSVLYSGWWDHRKQGDSWTAEMPDTREFTINNTVVSYPRPEEDKTKVGMNDIPVGGTVKLRARLRLRWGDTNIQFEDIDGDNQNELTFVYNGVKYGGDYVEKTPGQVYQVGNIYLEKSAGGYWTIDYDTTIPGIEVAGGGGGLPIEIIGAAVVIVVVLVAVFMLMKRKGGMPEGEILVPPEASPETPPPQAPPEAPPSEAPAPPEETPSGGF
ncbi:MAG: hypothetical protein QXG38_03010, partial [Candidatus Hadarchaeales archaeon]